MDKKKIFDLNDINEENLPETFELEIHKCRMLIDAEYLNKARRLKTRPDLEMIFIKASGHWKEPRNRYKCRLIRGLKGDIYGEGWDEE